jgi:hypothetical protein
MVRAGGPSTTERVIDLDNIPIREYTHIRASHRKGPAHDRRPSAQRPRSPPRAAPARRGLHAPCRAGPRVAGAAVHPSAARPLHRAHDPPPRRAHRRVGASLCPSARTLRRPRRAARTPPRHAAPHFRRSPCRPARDPRRRRLPEKSRFNPNGGAVPRGKAPQSQGRRPRRQCEPPYARRLFPPRHSATRRAPRPRRRNPRLHRRLQCRPGVVRPARRGLRRAVRSAAA